jgi:DOmain of unknown function (DUF4883)
MKKFLTLILLIIISFSFTGCNLNTSQYIRPKAKPSANYYTNEIQDKISENLEYTLRIFDMDYYKYYEVDIEEHSILPEFIDSLSDENYSVTLENDLNPKYKLIVEFSDSKYIINLYDNNLISIYPWDGVFKEDVATMDGISDYYNIYKFCEYAKKVSNGFEG